MHTPRCNHASGSILDYAEAALQHGLTEIGMSDHSPLPDGFDASWRMKHSELDHYLNELSHVQTMMKRQGLTVRYGLEIDFYPDNESYIQELLDYYPWDYVIGSIHFLGDWGFDNPEDQSGWQHWGLAQAWCAYFDAVAASAASGLFDIIGHPDLLKKYNHCQPNDETVHAAENRMLQAVKNAGVALEISSAGLRKPVAEIYPRHTMVAKAAHLDIPFAYGSDAHKPHQVGAAMQACLQCLQQYGIEHIASFDKRQRTLQAITHVG
jgi:histidinol-phosphatase (PHP family)